MGGVTTRVLKFIIGVGGTGSISWAGPFLFQDISIFKQNPKKKIDFMHFWPFAPQKTVKSIFGPRGRSEKSISSTKASFMILGNPQ